MTDHGQASGQRSDFAPDDALGHSGELLMRELFPSSYHWDERSLAAMMSPVIHLGLAQFIQAQPFFFIATSSSGGHCDCSFRGREEDGSGNHGPALRVIDQGSLVFPDFSGNGLYNSLGNIQTNPHIGLLFIDFQRRRRVRVNGIAQVIPADGDITRIWPTAQAAVLVKVEQAFGNCPARIPLMLWADDADPR